jgi:hypothetical protein
LNLFSWVQSIDLTRRAYLRISPLRSNRLIRSLVPAAAPQPPAWALRMEAAVRRLAAPLRFVAPADYRWHKRALRAASVFAHDVHRSIVARSERSTAPPYIPPLRRPRHRSARTPPRRIPRPMRRRLDVPRQRRPTTSATALSLKLPVHFSLTLPFVSLRDVRDECGEKRVQMRRLGFPYRGLVITCARRKFLE